MSWIGQWVQEKAASYLTAGVQAGGTLAGNAVGGVGTLVEDSGRSLGQSVTGGVNGVGDYINGYGASIKNSTAADGPANRARKPTAVKPTTAGQKRASPTASAVSKTLPSSTKALSSPTPKNATPSTTIPSTSQRSGASLNRSKETLTTNSQAKHSPSLKPNEPPFAPTSSQRRPDGKVSVSAASRPKSTPGSIGTASRDSHSLNSSNARNASAQQRREGTKSGHVPRSDGKDVMSAASRPRRNKA